ncbi:kinesin-like protein KIN-4C isoform X1 [Actinia tenebrosa]|uniref:Kinesin-like protein KIN-4C isoform X1 n=1 Tax=Actinia tenebrosa TaxID=6105 RepID=A0A6P8J2X7_ACTTE|nr:kinesin-like protein KIN-4C isoform X1 [Actinia tenebrosa]
MSQQVSAMGRQLDELNWKKAQIENALKQFQKESSEDKENHLRIILYFREVMGERTKKIKELEAEVQVLKNTNPENDFPVQLYEKAEILEHELSQLYLKTKTNSELLMRVKENCQEVRNENEKLKEDLRKKEDEIQMQQASQAASYLSREVELAGRVYEEVNRLQRVYVELMEFARRQGFQWTGALNDESDDE